MDNHKGENLVLRCFGFRGTNKGRKGFYAACLDVGVVTFRPTLEEAKKSLDDAVIGYIESAYEISDSKDEFLNLLNRPLPFYPWFLKFNILSAVSVFKPKPQKNDSVLFEKSIPVPSH